MSKTYLITYDLNSPRANDIYTRLFEAINRLFSISWKRLDSTWIVKSHFSATEIRNTLMNLLDSNDELIVVGLDGEGAWTGLKPEDTQWLQSNL